MTSPLDYKGSLRRQFSSSLLKIPRRNIETKPGRREQRNFGLLFLSLSYSFLIFHSQNLPGEGKYQLQNLWREREHWSGATIRQDKRIRIYRHVLFFQYKVGATILWIRNTLTSANLGNKQKIFVVSLTNSTLLTRISTAGENQIIPAGSSVIWCSVIRSLINI